MLELFNIILVPRTVRNLFNDLLDFFTVSHFEKKEVLGPVQRNFEFRLNFWSRLGFE